MQIMVHMPTIKNFAQGLTDINYGAGEQLKITSRTYEHTLIKLFIQYILETREEQWIYAIESIIVIFY